jgi:hypothetical protein
MRASEKSLDGADLAFETTRTLIFAVIFAMIVARK